MSNASARHLLWLAFFLTGATSLVFEVVWTRLLLLSFGTTPAASGVVLGAFMGGMAIGSWAAGHVTGPGQGHVRESSSPVSCLLSPVSCSPVLLYALLEAWVGVYALASPWLLGLVQAAHGLPGLAMATLVLLPATIAIGASLPVLVRAVADGRERPAVTLGRLYACNTAGAVTGPLLAVYVLFPSFGLRSALVAAALCNVAIAAVLWFVAASVRMSGAAATEPVAAPEPVARAFRPGEGEGTLAWLTMSLVAVSGGTAMIYEVAWNRMLSMVYGSSVYGVSLMLSTFLLGIAAGSMLAAQVLKTWRASTGSARPELVEGRGRPSPVALARLLVASACAAFLSLLVVRFLPWLFLDLFRHGWGADLGLALTQLITAALLMLPTTLCLGAMLPVATAAAPVSADDRTVSRMYTSNLIGSASGAVLASGLLLANLGPDFSVRLGATVALAVSIVIIVKEPRLHLATMSIAALSAVVVLAVDASGGRLVQSFGIYTSAPTYAGYDRQGMRRVLGAHQLLYYRDGPTATVAVQKVDRYLLMKINGKTDASNGAGDIETQTLLGHLPLLAAGARRVAVVGWGSGMTAAAVLTHPVDAVDAFEIEPAVIEASRYFDELTGRPLDDPRLRLILGDARGELVRHNQPYDVIISEPSNPWLTGVANLFTREFFELAAARLGPGGIMCQWFHIYGMSEESVRTLLATFRDVFPHTVVFKDLDLIVVGARQPIRFSLARLVDRFKIVGVKTSLSRAFVAYPADLLIKLRLDETGVTEFAQGVPINTDDNMLIELDAPRTLYADEVDAIGAALDRYAPDALALMTDYGTEAEAHFELAASYFTAGQDERALRHCERALALGASFERLKLLGQIEQRRGHPDRARAAWQSALAAGGDPAGRAFVSALLSSLDAPAGS